MHVKRSDAQHAAAGVKVPPYVHMPFLLSPAYCVPRMTISLWARLVLMLVEELMYDSYCGARHTRQTQQEHWAATAVVL